MRSIHWLLAAILVLLLVYPVTLLVGFVAPPLLMVLGLGAAAVGVVRARAEDRA